VSDLKQAHILATGAASQWMSSVAIAAATVKKAFLEQQLAAQQLEARLKSMNGSNAESIDQLEQVVNRFNLLDESSLSKIRGEVSRLRSEQEALNSSIESTLRSLQDERDRLAGNESSIEMRDYQNKLEDLQRQLQAAQEANNQVAVQDANEAIRILRQVHNEKMRLLRIEAQEQSMVATQSSRSPTAGANEAVAVTINLNDRSQVTGNYSKADAQTLLDELQSLANTGG
jgi:hypothetical protein